MSPSSSSAPVAHEPNRSVRILRRTIATVIVVAFSLAAAGGIIVLLSDIESEATYKVISTTALTGALSVAAFCGATLIGRRIQWFGITTIAFAVLSMGLSLWFLWGDPYSDPDNYSVAETLFQMLTSSALITAVASVSSLILLLSARTRVVRIGLPITLGLLALGTCLALIMIWVIDAWEYEWLTRLNGIVWILAALGVVVVPLTSLLLKPGHKPEAVAASPAADPTATEPSPAMGPAEVAAPATSDPDVSAPAASAPTSTLSDAALGRLEAAAQAEGTTADDLLDRLLATDQGHGQSN